MEEVYDHHTQRTLSQRSAGFGPHLPAGFPKQKILPSFCCISEYNLAAAPEDG